MAGRRTRGRASSSRFDTSEETIDLESRGSKQSESFSTKGKVPSELEVIDGAPPLSPSLKFPLNRKDLVEAQRGLNEPSAYHFPTAQCPHLSLCHQLVRTTITSDVFFFSCPQHGPNREGIQRTKSAYSEFVRPTSSLELK